MEEREAAMTLENPALVAALAALEKEAQINPDAAVLWKRIEPNKYVAIHVLRELILSYGCGYVETTTPLFAISMISLLEGCLPLPRKLLQ